MKNIRSFLLAAVALAAVAFFAPVVCHAQAAAPAADTSAPAAISSAQPAPASASSIKADPSNFVPVEAQNIVLAFFLSLAKAHPYVGTLLSIMALLRTFAKPISSVVHAVVDLTPSKTDDGILNAVLAWFSTPVGKAAAYVLDWVTSIKVIPPAKPASIV